MYIINRKEFIIISNKVKDIIFYCVIGALAIVVGIAAVLEAVKGKGNLGISIAIAVLSVVLLALSSIEVVDAAKTKETTKAVETKPVVEEAKSAETTTSVKPVTKKTSAKKSTTKKSTK